jgi:hypothetical protein
MNPNKESRKATVHECKSRRNHIFVSKSITLTNGPLNLHDPVSPGIIRCYTFVEPIWQYMNLLMHSWRGPRARGAACGGVERKSWGRSNSTISTPLSPRDNPANSLKVPELILIFPFWMAISIRRVIADQNGSDVCETNIFLENESPRTINHGTGLFAPPLLSDYLISWHALTHKWFHIFLYSSSTGNWISHCPSAGWDLNRVPQTARNFPFTKIRIVLARDRMEEYRAEMGKRLGAREWERSWSFWGDHDSNG